MGWIVGCVKVHAAARQQGSERKAQGAANVDDEGVPRAKVLILAIKQNLGIKGHGWPRHVFRQPHLPNVRLVNSAALKILAGQHAFAPVGARRTIHQKLLCPGVLYKSLQGSGILL